MRVLAIDHGDVRLRRRGARPRHPRHLGIQRDQVDGDREFCAGRDVWFRVLDGGEGAAAPPDRTTIFGFEGDRDVITSAEYCAARLWLDNNANTHAVTRGNIQVRP